MSKGTELKESTECLEELWSYADAEALGEGPRQDRGEVLSVPWQPPGPLSLGIWHGTPYIRVLKSFFGWDNVGRGRRPRGGCCSMSR